MQGRELGCKTIGCGVAILIVFLCFYGMIATTKNIARRVKEKQAIKHSQTATQNLQMVSIAVASYEAAVGHLPPTTTPEAFQNALSPAYLNDTSVLSDPGTNKPFSPNPAISEKNRFTLRGHTVPLLSTEPNTQGIRTVLLLSGEVTQINTKAWELLTAPRKPQPAPAGKSTPGASPALSP